MPFGVRELWNFCSRERKYVGTKVPVTGVRHHVLASDYRRVFCALAVMYAVPRPIIHQYDWCLTSRLLFGQLRDTAWLFIPLRASYLAM